MRGVTIFYDDDCSFCKQWVYRFKRFLMIRTLEIKRAQDDPLRYQQMQREDSWIIVDADNNEYVRYQGFLALARRSPLLIALYPLLALPISAFIGDRLYQYIAKQRGMKRGAPEQDR